MSVYLQPSFCKVASCTSQHLTQLADGVLSRPHNDSSAEWHDVGFGGGGGGGGEKQIAGGVKSSGFAMPSTTSLNSSIKDNSGLRPAAVEVKICCDTGTQVCPVTTHRA